MGRYTELIAEAHALARPISPSASCDAGGVAAVIVAESGRHFGGICMEFACSLGCCAEHAAVAEMLKHHESRIALAVAVDWSGKVLPPCGRCREMLWQLNDANRDAMIVLGEDAAQPLHVLLPYPWQQA
jgi:cytidine deaminase